MIKTAGYRVSPTELEEVAHRCESVTQAVALGLPHPGLGQAILLVASSGGAVAQEQLASTLLSHCRRCLPAYMVPLAVECCADLPLTPNNKIDRQALRRRYLDIFARDSAG